MTIIGMSSPLGMASSCVRHLAWLVCLFGICVCDRHLTQMHSSLLLQVEVQSTTVIWRVLFLPYSLFVMPVCAVIVTIRCRLDVLFNAVNWLRVFSGLPLYHFALSASVFL